MLFSLLIYHNNLQCLAKQFDLTEHVCGTKVVYGRRQEKRMHEQHEHKEGIAMNHDARFTDSLKSCSIIYKATCLVHIVLGLLHHIKIRDM